MKRLRKSGRMAAASALVAALPLTFAACSATESTATYDEDAFVAELVPVLSFVLTDESQETIRSTADCIASEALSKLDDSDLQELKSKGFNDAELSDSGFEIVDTAFDTCIK